MIRERILLCCSLPAPERIAVIHSSGCALRILLGARTAEAGHTAGAMQRVL